MHPKKYNNTLMHGKKIRKRMQSFIGFCFVPTVVIFIPNYLQIDTKRFAKLLYFHRIYVLLSCD